MGGTSKAQLHVVESLAPKSPPHAAKTTAYLIGGSAAG
jgi:hypothetical protein